MGILQPSDITAPGRYTYHDPGADPQPVDVVRSGEELVVRFADMEPGDEDAVPLAAVAGWFEARA